MARVSITGRSRAGKTTVLDELGRRGHMSVHTDDDGWGAPDRRSVRGRYVQSAMQVFTVERLGC